MSINVNFFSDSRGYVKNYPDICNKIELILVLRTI